jgi:hypothetical protein
VLVASRPLADVLEARQESHMKIAHRALLGLALCVSTAACNEYLRLEILNATDDHIVVVVGSDEKRVEPGVSYSARYPVGRSTITVRTLRCSRDYATPNLDQSPWKYLIGRSVKFRAVQSGLLIAYPPTPDVELKGNPLRAMRDGTLMLRPVRTFCRAS